MIHTRADGGTEVLDADMARREIVVIAAPYDRPTMVDYRGRTWQESFAPGAFDGVEAAPERVRVNREHSRADAIGKCMRPSTPAIAAG